MFVVVHRCLDSAAIPDYDVAVSDVAVTKRSPKQHPVSNRDSTFHSIHCGIGMELKIEQHRK